MLTKYARVFLSLVILICVISSISYATTTVDECFNEIRELYNEKPNVRNGNLSDKDIYTYNITELVYYNKTPEALDYATKYWRSDNYPRIDNRQLINTLTDIAKIEGQIKNNIATSEQLWNQGDIVKAKQLLSWVMKNTPNIDLTTDMIYGTNLTRALQSYKFVTESVEKTLNAMGSVEQSQLEVRRQEEAQERERQQKARERQEAQQAEQRRIAAAKEEERLRVERQKEEQLRAERIKEEERRRIEGIKNPILVEIVDLNLSPKDYLNKIVKVQGAIHYHDRDKHRIDIADVADNRIVVWYYDMSKDQQRIVLMKKDYSQIDVVGEVVPLQSGNMGINAISVK